MEAMGDQAGRAGVTNVIDCSVVFVCVLISVMFVCDVRHNMLCCFALCF